MRWSELLHHPILSEIIHPSPKLLIISRPIYTVWQHHMLQPAGQQLCVLLEFALSLSYKALSLPVTSASHHHLAFSSLPMSMLSSTQNNSMSPSSALFLEMPIMPLANARPMMSQLQGASMLTHH